MSQKSALAPAALRVNRTMGETDSAFAMSLQKIRFSPKMVYVAAIARCPESLPVSILHGKKIVFQGRTGVAEGLGLTGQRSYAAEFFGLLQGPSVPKPVICA